MLAINSRSGLFSYQSLIPVGAGTPRYEKLELWVGTASWHRRILPLPVPTPAGDKPPRYIGLGEVVADFSIDVLPRGIRAWIPASAGMTIAGFGGFRSHGTRRLKSFSYQSLIPVVAGTPRCENWGALVVEEFESHWHFESAYQSDSGDPSSTPSCRHSAKSEHAYQLYSFWGRPQPVDHLRGGRYEFSN